MEQKCLARSLNLTGNQNLYDYYHSQEKVKKGEENSTLKTQALFNLLNTKALDHQVKPDTLEAPFAISTSFTPDSFEKSEIATATSSSHKGKLLLGVSVIGAIALAVILSGQSEQSKTDNLNNYYNNLNNSFISSRVLEPIFITAQDQLVLNNRHTLPSSYFTTPISDFFGNNNSTIYKVIRLSAALSEMPKSLYPLAHKMLINCPGSGWCSIEGLETLTEEQKNENQGILNQIPDDDLTAHFKEMKNTPIPFIYYLKYQSKGGESFPDNNKYSTYSIQRSEYRNHLQKFYEPRAQWAVEFKRNDPNSLLKLMRYVRDSEGKGFEWEGYQIECEKKASDEVYCKTLDGLDFYHIKGPMAYSIHEKLQSQNCSKITEKLQFSESNEEFMKTYFINPNKQLPFVFPRFINPIRFSEDKIGFNKENVIDAKVITPTIFPDNLPDSCEALLS